MSFYTGGIDFSKLYEVQASGNNGAAGGGNIGAVDSQKEPQGKEMEKFKKDVDFSKLKLQ